jgi:hypothetical protein
MKMNILSLELRPHIMSHETSDISDVPYWYSTLKIFLFEFEKL